MNIQDLLVVKIGENIYGFDADKIQHILRVPTITNVPLSGKGILGISIILGKIISVIEPSVVLEEKEVLISNEEARILTISDEVAIVVDFVNEMIAVDEENFEESEDELVIGFYKKDDKIIQIIKPTKIVEKIDVLDYKPIVLDSFETDKKTAQTNNSDTERLLFFKVENEKFAIDIELLKEIIYIPEITPTTNSDILGVLTLRDEVISVLDLNTLLGFNSEIDKKTRALILWYGNKSVALLVDEVEMVEDASISQIESLPENFKDSKIEGLYKDNKEIISILSQTFIRDLIKKYHITEEDTKQDEEIKDLNMKELAVFKVSNEEYSFDIKDVQEIIKYDETTPLPEAPEFVEGLFNLRGNIIPIVSLQERLGFDKKIDDKTKIIVCNIDDEKIGLIVDDVSDIMFVEDKYISRTSNKESVFDEVVTLDEGKRVILNINLNKLINEETLENIKMVKEGN